MSPLPPEAAVGLLIAFAFALLTARAAVRTQAEARSAGAGHGSQWGGGAGNRRRLLRALLVPLGLALAFLAVAEGETELPAPSGEAPETLIVLDVSKSMLARAGATCRLERARADVAAALPGLSRHRLGLIAAAGRPRVACPVTGDHDALGDFLDRLDPDLEERGGSSVLAAVATALERFTETESPVPRSVLVLSDGEWQDAERLVEIADEARRRGVVVLGICYGSPEGAQLFAQDTSGLMQPRRNSEGEPIWSRAHPENLRALAEATGGRRLASLEELSDLERFAPVPTSHGRGAVQGLLLLALLCWVGETWWKGRR